jgi:subtilisin family serine protease
MHILLIAERGGQSSIAEIREHVDGIDGVTLLEGIYAVTGESVETLTAISQRFPGAIVSNMNLRHTSATSRNTRAIVGKPHGLEAIGRYDDLGAHCYGDGVVVANIDDGVCASHPEYRDRYMGHWYGLNKQSGVPTIYNEGDDWITDHGTNTMGGMCGKTIGVAPQASFTYIKLFNSSTASICDMLRLLDLLLRSHADNPNRYRVPNVITCSFSADITPHSTVPDDLVVDYGALLEHIYESFPETLFIFPAGDSARLESVEQVIELPSFLSNAISIGSARITNSDSAEFTVSAFSSYGKSIRAGSISNRVSALVRPVCLAPGEAIITSTPISVNKSGYVGVSGTSIACAIAAGTIACFYSELLAKGMSPVDIRRLVMKRLNTQRSYLAHTPNTVGVGYGMIRLDRLLSPVN